jgi:GNAT superfamily N-acetyltransferase
VSQASSTAKDGDQWLAHRVAVPSAAPRMPVLIRRVAAGDRPALAEMLARCSDQTRERRFHKYVGCFPEPYLAEALAGRATHFSLLAQADQAVVALASCVATGRGSAELAVLVEDSWQRLGVGARLLSLLVAHADQSGLTRLEAWVLDSQAWVLPVLGGYGICETWLRHGVFEVTVHRSGS